jgi:hypothetical protein
MYMYSNDVVPPEAMKDRARALLGLVKQNRNQLYNTHRIFLRKLCELYPDIEAIAREKVTAAARALHGKKGPMIHTVYQPQSPAIDQSLELKDEEANGLDVNDADASSEFLKALKGIARKLIYYQSNPPNGNVALLINLVQNQGELDIALKVLTAQRWHLRAGHEPLSALFLTKALNIWNTEEDPAWAVKLGDYVEAAVSKESNFAILLSPNALVKVLQIASQRQVLESKDAQGILDWTLFMLRLHAMASAYVGRSHEASAEVAAAYLEASALALNKLKEIPEFESVMIPENDTSLQDLLYNVVKSNINEESVRIVHPFTLCQAMKGFISRNETIPDAIIKRSSEGPSYLQFMVDFAEGKIDVHAEIEPDPEGYKKNIVAFFKAFNVA